MVYNLHPEGMKGKGRYASEYRKFKSVNEAKRWSREQSERAGKIVVRNDS